MTGSYEVTAAELTQFIERAEAIEGEKRACNGGIAVTRGRVFTI
ncbi:MAG: hypothetical protein U5N55_04745 [Cypionkella sp.]|nr:hypothetical protein [Cypionkella sp.]